MDWSTTTAHDEVMREGWTQEYEYESQGKIESVDQ